MDSKQSEQLPPEMKAAMLRMNRAGLKAVDSFVQVLADEQASKATRQFWLGDSITIDHSPWNGVTADVEQVNRTTLTVRVQDGWRGDVSATLCRRVQSPVSSVAGTKTICVEVDGKPRAIRINRHTTGQDICEQFGRESDWRLTIRNGPNVKFTDTPLPQHEPLFPQVEDGQVLVCINASVFEDFLRIANVPAMSLSSD